MHIENLDDGLVVALVLALRLVVPLLIPTFPLPALIASLVIDGVDKSIFEQFTSMQLDWYQSYDKALDIYYLTIAYLSVLRNWRSTTAVAVAAALWYYRLVGVMAFELTQVRALLMVFPNTFEYFVIAIEVVRTRWDPARLTRRALIGTAAVIWVVVKLPQEWWIHVAQLDFTDEFARVVLGVDPEAGWGAGFANRPWVVVLLVALVVAAVVAVRRLWPLLPAPDWPLTFRADRVAELTGWVPRGAGPRRPRALWDRHLLEKVVLAGLVTAIMFEVYPGPEASVVEVFGVVALVVVLNGALSLARARRGGGPRPFLVTAAAAFVANGAALALFTALVGGRRGILSTGDALFFTYLITLVVVLYDTFTARRAASERTVPAV
ncbi:hypothetical protein AGMMS50218_03070 [Actinomycetota bacterium]|nr:hypothetical protein AGMMS50218_03070 [Actinomycetota bacterium]